MESAGLDRVVRAEDVAIMGITEVIRHMPHIYREYRRLVSSIKLRRPAIAILIDFPDVNLRLAKELKQLGIPVIYFVSPQLWAWKRSRLRWVQQRVDRMLVIFPFEETFYRARGVDAEFVGHPLATLPTPTVSRGEYAAQHRLDPAKPWIALLPGSRRKEILLNLPTMLETAILLNRDYEFVLPVASTIPLYWLQTQVAAANIRFVPDAREALLHARASIVASGTATVQAAVIGNPFVVVYRVSPLTFALAKRLVRYPMEIPAPVDNDGHLPVAMVNLIAGRRIVPELLQERFNSQNLLATLRPLLEDGLERETMIQELATVKQSLLQEGELSPIARVCDAVQFQLVKAGLIFSASV